MHDNARNTVQKSLVQSGDENKAAVCWKFCRMRSATEIVHPVCANHS